MMTPNVIARVMLIAFGAFLIAVPWLIPALLNKFWVSVIAEIMIWSLFAASVNLLFGYVGSVVVWAGALFRVWHVRSGDRRRHSGPVVLAGFWIGHSRLRGDCAGLRDFRGAPDLALFRHHHRGVFSDLLFFRGIGKADDRRRRRHQFLHCRRLSLLAASREASAMRIFSTSSFWRPFRFASFSCIA